MNIRGGVGRLLRGAGIAVSALALVAIFSLSFGVTRYTAVLDLAMHAYGSSIGILFGALIDGAAGWVAEQAFDWLDIRLTIASVWKDVFTLLTLYVFADSSGFLRRGLAPEPGADGKAELKMFAASVLAGFVLALAAAIAVGLTPVDHGWQGDAVLFAAPVIAVGLYWVCVAAAHATWNRENFRLFRGVDETFGQAFRIRAVRALVRSGAGLVIGAALTAMFVIAGVPRPGLLALAVLALILGLFWIYRSTNPDDRSRPLQERMKSATGSDNFAMGMDMLAKVAVGGLLAGANAIAVQAG
ncbi:MAG: hypothetical protein ACK4Y4_00255 [Brevundimonas sp.]